MRNNSRFGSHLHIRNANVVGAAILLDHNDVTFGGRIGTEYRRKLATVSTSHSVGLFIQTVTNFGLDGRQFVADQRTNVDGVGAAESLPFNECVRLIEIGPSL